MSASPECTAAAEVASLLDHARTHKGFHIAGALEFRDGERGRGVFTKEGVTTSNALLLLVPQTLSIEPLPALNELVRRGETSRLLALTLTMLHGLHEESKSATYYALLKASPLPDTPLLWSAQDLAQLEGTSLLRGRAGAGADTAAAAAAAAAASCFELDVLPIMERAGDAAVPKASRTATSFTTALAWVMSRAVLGRVAYEFDEPRLWPYLRPDGPATDTHLRLLPVFDCINTSPEPAACNAKLVQPGSDLGGWEVRTLRPLKAGEEILISYGHHGAAELVRTYGVAPTGGAKAGAPSRSSAATGVNPNTDVNFSREEVLRAVRAALSRHGRHGGAAAGSEDDDSSGDVLSEADASARFAALEGAGRLPVCFTVTSLLTAVPPMLLTAVQVLLMDAEEYSEWEAAGCISLGVSFLDDASLPHVVGSLLSLVNARVHELGAGGDAAEARAGEAAPLAVRMGRGLRVEERQVLDALKRAVLSLEVADEDEEEESEDESGSSVSEDEEEQDAAPAGAGAPPGHGGAGKRQRTGD